jgi:hypothetical protein
MISILSVDYIQYILKNNNKSKYLKFASAIYLKLKYGINFNINNDLLNKIIDEAKQFFDKN